MKTGNIIALIVLAINVVLLTIIAVSYYSASPDYLLTYGVAKGFWTWVTIEICVLITVLPFLMTMLYFKLFTLRDGDTWKEFANILAVYCASAAILVGAYMIIWESLALWNSDIPDRLYWFLFDLDDSAGYALIVALAVFLLSLGRALVPKIHKPKENGSQ